MNIKPLNPSDISYHFKSQSITRTEIEKFKDNLKELLESIRGDRNEEFHKTPIMNFLVDTYYHRDFYINNYKNIDLVIHNGRESDSKVGVIFETKNINSPEMMRVDNLNTKAFQQLIYYYLRERIANKNLDIKHLIATDSFEWFIFDATLFERLFAENKDLVREFEDFEAKRLVSNRTPLFYKQIAKEFIDSITTEIEFIHFNLRGYEKQLNNPDTQEDSELIALYEVLHPKHLLKLPVPNDSNSLNKAFYNELLHIIGLGETKKGGKKLIDRKNPEERHTGTILEDAIIQLDSLDKISRLDKPEQFGTNKQQRLFNVALELSITWINRILFLKLLEGQLKTYHDGDKTYSFLNNYKVKNYGDLNSLFFQVLARKYEERNEDVKRMFEKVPYLNSSLFEPTELEQVTLFVSNLKDDKTIPVFSQTVLKDQHGKKRSGNMTTLQYLFEFLDAYDFGAKEGSKIQEDKKTLINASVLGLIFEKINGYKDGSFFTPGFITEYMCRETIRKAVVQKFNDTKDWNCKNWEDLYERIEFNTIEGRKEANSIINSIKICDPAVGSGHFLVSALNEMIAIKNDLKILQDRDGKRLKEYQVEVVNDELIVTDEDRKLFEYKPLFEGSQRIQETLFHEKQTIIENCLFGVDINPNSVKICRLRLWIELLKNAYYKNRTELETLPNIDINIKCGNSLVSRFALDADMKQALKKSKWSIDSYRLAVATYRVAENKEQKREMEGLISTIKSDFRSEISKHDPRFKKLQKLEKEYSLLVAPNIFKEDESQYGSKDNKKKAKERENKLFAEIQALKAEIEEIKGNKVFENAFEWRFEFPEVLNDDGDFVGFDVVIGNPPYMQLQSMTETAKQLQQFGYKTYSSMGDLYALFYERGSQILQQRGILCYISGSAWMRANYGQPLRSYFNQETQLLEVIDLSDCEIFDSATVLTSIISFSKKNGDLKPFKAIRFTKKDQGKLINLSEEIKANATLIYSFPESSWIILDSAASAIKEKVESQGKLLKDWDIKINYGIKTGLNGAFVIKSETRAKLIDEDPKSEELIKPLLRGRDVHRYFYQFSNHWLLNVHNGIKEVAVDPINIDEYPAIKEHLDKYYEKIQKRSDKGITPYHLRNCAYIDDFSKPKIIYPNMTKFLPFTLDVDGNFLNDKCFILSGEKLYFLVAFLNSKIFHFCFADAFPELQGNSKEIKKFILETIPVKKISDETPYKEKVQAILNLKKQNPSADTTDIEHQIDQLIYQLYDLSEEEIRVVENRI